jgi:TDG/mug DNA glycosylase family protein
MNRLTSASLEMPLADHLRPGLDVLFVGINPGLRSAATGHHYAGPGNHFWPLLFESGLVSEPITYEQDTRILDWNMGLTNIVGRASASLSEVSVEELRAGAVVLRSRILELEPVFACFNGKRIYEVFSGRACSLGLQAERLARTSIFVMPSTSARTAAYQRPDKLRFFRELADLVLPLRRAAS